MPRAVWTGALAFGLVSIPVALYPATEPKDVRFHLIDPETGRRVRYRRVVEVPAGGDEGRPSDDPGTEDAPRERDGGGDAGGPRSGGVREVEVEYRGLARGYEVERDRSVILDPEEIARVRPTRSSTIELEHFVPLADIDPVFFEKSYYLEPRGDAERPYGLMRRALEASGRAGIGRFVLRTKPYLVAVRPVGPALGLETLYFSDEVRAPEAFAPAATEAPDREVRLARQLVEVLAEEWVPERYGDDFREELLRLIAEKTPVDHESAERAVADRPGTEELMAALRRSVAEAKARRARPDRSSERAG